MESSTKASVDANEAFDFQSVAKYSKSPAKHPLTLLSGTVCFPDLHILVETELTSGLALQGHNI